MLQNIHPIDTDAIAGFLADGYVGGLALGRAEAGPRALGHRSILACARTMSTKERINGLIKHRQAFQPLAPLCLSEDLATYFEFPEAEVTLRYMTFALRCTNATRAQAPAIVHADGTARVQIVDEHAPPLLTAILRAYRRLTGVGILINTSLNGRGDPLVNTAAEAVTAYKRLDLDFLVLDRYLISSRVC
jgi:carbamoyltransferase